MYIPVVAKNKIVIVTCLSFLVKHPEEVFVFVFVFVFPHPTSLLLWVKYVSHKWVQKQAARQTKEEGVIEGDVQK